DVDPRAHAARDRAVVGPHQVHGHVLAVVEVVLVPGGDEALVAVERRQVLLVEIVEHAPHRAAVHGLHTRHAAAPALGVEREPHALVVERREAHGPGPRTALAHLI